MIVLPRNVGGQWSAASTVALHTPAVSSRVPLPCIYYFIKNNYGISECLLKVPALMRAVP